MAELSDKSYFVAPLSRGDWLVARRGPPATGGPPYFGIERADGAVEHLTGRISRRAQRRLEKALWRAFADAVRRSRR